MLAHIFYEDMVDEIMASLGNIPVPYDLVVTTTTRQEARVDPSRARAVRAAVRATCGSWRRTAAATSSAFLVACRDVLVSATTT